MAKRIVTLFIRDTNINLLVMKGNRVEKWARLPLEPGLVSQGLVLDEAQVADKVKELFKLEKVRKKKVIVGLSGLDSLYRMITLPELPEAVLTEAVKHEASRVVPVSLDEVHLSYQPIPAPRGETRVFLATFPRNVADALVRTLHQAGLEPYIMDLAPLALCRIPDEPRAIIVNARLEYLNIMVIADRIPQVIRSLSLPSEAKSLSENLSTITEEFSRTVAFYNSSHLEKPLDSTVPVFVCGELAEEAPETWQSVVGESGYSVSPLPSLVEYPEGFNPNEFMVNIGLALKELSLGKERANFSIVNLNILPEAYRPKAIRLAQILVPAGIVVGIGLLGYMGFLVQSSSAQSNVLNSQLTDIESRIGQQHKEIVTLKAQIELVEGEIKPVEAQMALVEAAAGVFTATLTSLEERREEVDADLSGIVSLVPTKLDLTEVSWGGSSISVSGIAADEDKIFGYARDLRSSGRFSIAMMSITREIEKIKGEEIGQFRFNLLLK